MATKRRRRKSEARDGLLPRTTTTRRTTAIRSPLDGDQFAHEREEPFRVTFFKVGTNLFFLCASAYVLYNVRSTLLSGTQRNGDGPSEAMYEASETTAGGDDWATEPARDEPPPDVVEADEHDDAPPPFPEFDLGTEVDYDAYGIARNPLFDVDAATSSSLKPFFRSAAKLREDFAYRCGGENAARFVLSRGSTTFSASNVDDDRDDRVEEGEGSGGSGGGSPFDLVPDGVRRTARRIFRARTSKRPFKMSFGGYSSTAGYGNRHNSSYPFVLQRILTEPMKRIGVDLVVTNAAMDGISAFPYGWCMENHFGRDVDVVSWDFAGNELAGSIDSLESYLRRASTMERTPMLIVKDTERAVKRRELLQRYVEEGVLLDPLLIHLDPAAKPFLELKDERRQLPPGFVNFEDFDGPPGSPGKVRQNLSSKGHELIGYMIGMHVLSALELVAAMDLVGGNKHGEARASSDPSESRSRGREFLLPAPVSKSAAIDDERDGGASSMLFGEPLANSPNPDDREGRTSKWTMNPVHCRTSFEPIIGGNSGSLDEIIVSGTIAEDIDVLLPKGPMIYNQGWTFDLSPTVKSEKKKLKRWEDSLGFQDWKKAYYGVMASGTMRLHVPYVGGGGRRGRGAAGRGKKEKVDDVDGVIQMLGGEGGVGSGVIVNASSFFKSLVVCDAASEIRGTDECDMERDATYVVGGAKARTVRAIDNDAVSYLGKKSCVHIGVPPEAIMTTRAETTEGEDDGKNVREPAARRSKENGAVVVDSDEKEAARRRSLVGVSLEISVSSQYVTWKKGPCSISHVIWEEQVR